MQSENPMFADLAKLLNSAAGTVAGIGRESRDAARERAREFFGGLDFVSRDEFEAVKAMAAKAREQAEALEVRLAALEARGATPTPVVAPPGHNPPAAGITD
jgi:BMFP domain-containing protein YqiC